MSKLSFQQTIVDYNVEIVRHRRLLDIPDLQQPHVYKEGEVLVDQQLFNQERNFSQDQEDPEPPQIKEEQEELCTSQDGEQLVLKQETDTFMLTTTYEENDQSEDENLSLNPDETVVNMPVIISVVSLANIDLQLLSNNSHVAESRDQEGVKHEHSGSTRDEEENVYNPTMLNPRCNTDTGKIYFRCDTCGKAYKKKSALHIHLRIHTGEKPYVCKTCGEDFRLSGRLKRHMKMAHAGEAPHVCNTCGKGFFCNSELSVHIRTHTGEKPYLCKLCGKRFITTSNLSAHVRTHTGEKPYLCKLCGRRFMNNSNLSVHMRIHTGERPFSCTLCGTGFTCYGSFTYHMRKHTGEKPFSCTFCARRFIQHSELTDHMRTHTGEKPYLCKICGRKFKKNSNLKDHMRTHR